MMTGGTIHHYRDFAERRLDLRLCPRNLAAREAYVLSLNGMVFSAR
jgi:hypothetical protein